MQNAKQIIAKKVIFMQNAKQIIAKKVMKIASKLMF